VFSYIDLIFYAKVKNSIVIFEFNFYYYKIITE